MSVPDDLYEYPNDYVGKKTYVSVAGHRLSIPKYKTYIGFDRRNYLRPEFGGNWDALPNNTAFLMPDKAGYLSPMDGTFVEGRSAHRDHMRQHGVLEAGDMKLGEFAGRENAAMSRAGHDIVRAMQELQSR